MDVLQALCSHPKRSSSRHVNVPLLAAKVRAARPPNCRLRSAADNLRPEWVR